MKIKTQFDLKKFQDEVLSRFESINKQIETARMISSTGYAFSISSDTGFLKRFVLNLLNPIGKYFNNAYFNSPIFLENEKYAMELINTPKILNTICQYLRKRNLSIFFKEELEIEVLLIVTEVLTQKEIAKEFSIEKNKELFSMITSKILEKGFEDYCSGKV
jgi:hypothetical protein